MDLEPPNELREAYARCEALAASHYENFPVASLLLKKALRPHVATLYAFARTADDFADEPAYEGRRSRELGLWEKGLRTALQGGRAHPYLRAFAHTMRAFGIPLSLPLALLKAFRMDASFKKFKDWPALLHYCRHSADPVGRMVLLIHGIQEERLHRLSDRICTGLQLTNFWQDTLQDLSRGRIYYPLAEIRRSGVRESDLFQGRDAPKVRTLAKTVVERTGALLRSGHPLLRSVPGRLGLELRATYRGGLYILRKIRDNDYNVLGRRPRLSGYDKALIGLEALFGP